MPPRRKKQRREEAEDSTAEESTQVANESPPSTSPNALTEPIASDPPFDATDPQTAQPNGETSAPTTPRKRGRPRKDSIAGREEKEDEPDLDELCDTLEKLLFVLSSEDEEGYFSRPVNVDADPRYLELVKKPMDFGSMEKKLAERAYKTLCEFQDDFDLVMKNAMLYHPASDEIHQLASRLWNFGSRLINSQYERFPKYLTVEPKDTQTTTRSAAKAKAAEVKERIFRPHKYALCQKGPDGTYFFTSTQTKPLDDVYLVDDVDKVNIVPTYSEEQASVPTLKAAVRTENKAVENLRRTLKKRNEHAVVDFFDYGIFYSFAPLADTSKATLSQPDSVRIICPGRRIVLEADEDIEPPSPDEVKIFRGSEETEVKGGTIDAISILNAVQLADVKMTSEARLDDEGAKLLQDEGVDLNAVLAVPVLLDSTKQQEKDEMEEHGEKEKEDDKEAQLTGYTPEHLLSENINLVAELEFHQNWRFEEGISEPKEDEICIIRRLFKNLRHLTNLNPPRELIAPEEIEAAVQRLRKYDSFYRGTLPSAKRYIYPSNLGGRTAFPTNAGTIGPGGAVKDYVPPKNPYGSTDISRAAQQEIPSLAQAASYPPPTSSNPYLPNLAQQSLAGLIGTPPLPMGLQSLTGSAGMIGSFGPGIIGNPRTGQTGGYLGGVGTGTWGL